MYRVTNFVQEKKQTAVMKELKVRSPWTAFASALPCEHELHSFPPTNPEAPSSRIEPKGEMTNASAMPTKLATSFGRPIYIGKSSPSEEGRCGGLFEGLPRWKTVENRPRNTERKRSTLPL
jgi:hypothetical protein